MEIIERLKTALETTGYDFAHFGWDNKPDGDFGVFCESGVTSLFADNQSNGYVGMSGKVYYYTRDNSSMPRCKIEAALSGIDSFWFKCTSVDYDFQNGYICYEWTWKAI